MGNRPVVATSLPPPSFPIQDTLVHTGHIGTGLWGSGRAPGAQGLTGVQLEHELDRVVVEMAAVLDDLDEGGQAALARGHLGHSDGCVELPENCTGGRRENVSVRSQAHRSQS